MFPFNDHFTVQDDGRGPFGRDSFSNFNSNHPHHQLPLNTHYRNVDNQSYPTPTAIDVFGPPTDPARGFDYGRDHHHSVAHKPHPGQQHGFHPVNGAFHGQSGTSSHHHSHRDEEISTIFVVGFPDDMLEREFQNMFTFSKGFEAASLKIPHKESHSSSTTAAGPFNPQSSAFSATQENFHHNPNSDLQAGGPWTAPLPDDGYGQSQANANAPPRKQIIGFAKFRTRSEALEARDLLQGRKVDVERGAVLKAEMAKKNLHTKRGPGPSGLPLSMVGPGGMVGADTLASLSGLPGGAAGLPTQSSGEVMRDRERELGTLGAMGFINGGGPRLRDRDAPVEQRRRDSSAISASRMFSKGDSDVEADNNLYLRSQNQVAFDAFHAVPVPQYRNPGQLPRSVLSPSDSMSSLSPSQDGLPTSTHLNGTAFIPTGPWESAAFTSDSSTQDSSPVSEASTFPPPMSGLSITTPPIMSHPPAQIQAEMNSNTGYSSSSEHFGNIGSGASHPASSASSMTGSRSSSDGDGDATKGLAPNFMAGLPISDSVGSGSPPELASPPYSNATSSKIPMASSDQNPPINTLYVGNLPSVSPPPGFGPNLEDSLRDLFSGCRGFRNLVYKYKNNSPMCFVEFEDVADATKALNDLYGNSVNGLVKTGIRLSYSKNPLGVRPRGQTVPASSQPPNQWQPSFYSSAHDGRLQGLGGYGPTPTQESTQRRFGEPSFSSVSMRRQSREALAEPLSNPASFSFGTQSSQTAISRYFSPPLGSPPFQPSGLTSRSTSNFGGPPMFSPFQDHPSSLTPLPREHPAHALTPSPGIEATRAG